MRIVVDGQEQHNHALVQSGDIELMSCARMYSFPNGFAGPAGSTNDPSQIADRIAPQLADQDRSGMLHLQGFGALTLEMNLDWGGGFKGLTSEDIIEGFARGKLLLSPVEMQWATQISDALGTVRPSSIHLDCEKFLNLDNIHDSDPTFFRKLMNHRRAMSMISAQSPELHALLTLQIRTAEQSRRYAIVWSQYARDMCSKALSDMLWQSGLTVPHGLVESVPIVAYLYYKGSSYAVDENGWPISTTTIDTKNSCYGFYGNSTKTTNLLIRAAQGAAHGAQHFVPVLSASDDPGVNAHRIASLNALGVDTAILYCGFNPDKMEIFETCAKNLTELHALGAFS